MREFLRGWRAPKVVKKALIIIYIRFSPLYNNRMKILKKIGNMIISDDRLNIAETLLTIDKGNFYMPILTWVLTFLISLKVPEPLVKRENMWLMLFFNVWSLHSAPIHILQVPNLMIFFWNLEYCESALRRSIYYSSLRFLLNSAKKLNIERSDRGRTSSSSRHAAGSFWIAYQHIQLRTTTQMRYSHDLASYDFFLFLTVKFIKKRIRF